MTSLFMNRFACFPLKTALFSLFLGLNALVSYGQTYCPSSSDFPWEDWIAGVALGSQENPSNKSAYTDFSANVNFSLAAGTHAVRLTAGFSFFNYDEHWRVWVDLNRDGDFDDAGELLLSELLPKGTDGITQKVLTGNLQIPSSAQGGLTRMRVSMSRTPFTNPCGTLPFGEVEDYAVTLSTQSGCTNDIGSGMVLCYENAPVSGQYYLYSSDFVRYTVNSNGQVLAQSSYSNVALDSTLVLGNQVIRKLANGTIAWQKVIPSNVLSMFPIIEAAVEMADGSFVLGGIQKEVLPNGGIPNDSLVLIKTDNNLNFQSYVAQNLGSSLRQFDKLLGFEKTQSGDIVAVYNTNRMFLVLENARNLTKYSPNLERKEGLSFTYQTFSQREKTPCGVYAFSYQYDLPSIKSARSGTMMELVDLETMTRLSSRNSEIGSVSYAGSYASESYFSHFFGNELTANYWISPATQQVNPFNIKLYRPDGTFFEKRPNLLPFQHIIQTDAVSVLILSTENGRILAFNPDCNTGNAPLPDIRLANLVVQNNNSNPGAVLNYTFNLVNAGTAPALGEYIITAYLSTDNQLSNNDLVAGYLNTGNTPVGTISGVQSAITVPGNLAAGTYFLLLKADVTDAIFETQENNNILATTSSITISPALADNCGFQVPISLDSAQIYTAASLGNEFVFRTSKHENSGDVTNFAYRALDEDGQTIRLESFPQSGTAIALTDDNFLRISTGSPNLVYLQKTNRAGTILWVKSLMVQGAAELDRLNFAEGINGDILLTGTCRPQNELSAVRQVWFLRANYSGDLVHQRQYFGTRVSEPTLNAFFAGEKTQNPYIVTETPLFPFGPQTRLLKIDGQNGNDSWTIQLQPLDRFRGLTETTDGGVLVTSINYTSPGGAPRVLGWLRKYTAFGALEFQQNFQDLVPPAPATGYYFTNGVGNVLQATDGGYITSFERPNYSIPPINPLKEVFIIRLNNNFDTIWTVKFTEGGVFHGLKAIPGGAFLGYRDASGSTQAELIKIGANGKISPCTSSTTYCASQSVFPWQDWIAGVKVGNLDNPSGKSTYSDFTSTVFSVQNGTPVTLTTGYSYFTHDEYWRIWIDLNKDGDFDDAGEKVLEQILTKPANGTLEKGISGVLTLPAGTYSGTTRMRVSMRRLAYATPCENLPFGEVEDYSVDLGVVSAQPNLRPTTWTLQTQAASPGATVNSTFSLQNTGNAPANGSYSVGVFLSTDNIWGPNDQLIGTQSFSNTASGASTNEAITFTIPQNTTSGAFFVLLRVDYANQIVESNESDNTLQSSFNVGTCSLSAEVSGVSCQGTNTTFTLVVNAQNGSSGGWIGTFNTNPFGGPTIFTGLYGVPQVIQVYKGTNNSTQLSVFDNTFTTCITTFEVLCPSQPGTYCSSEGTFPWEEWIAAVKVGTEEKTSGKSPYSNFTNTIFTVENGTPITLTTGFSFFTHDEYWRIWIDLNKDGDFEDAGEKVLEQILSKPSDGTTSKSISGALTLPSGNWSGSTRMRVSMKRGGFAGPCEEFAQGEVEDYTVQFGTTGGGNAPDLELSIQADKTNPAIYSTVNTVFTVKNMGTAAISQAVVFLSLCPDLSYPNFVNDRGLVYGGAIPAPTVGNYNFIAQRWTINNLNPGQTATLSIPFFTLTAAERNIVAFVEQQTPADADSQPSNSLPDCLPTQDDEAIWTLNVGQAVLESGTKVPFDWKYEVDAGIQIFPNPASDYVRVYVPKSAGKQLKISVLDALGNKVFTQESTENQGEIHLVSLGDLRNGQYLMQISLENERPRMHKLIILRTY